MLTIRASYQHDDSIDGVSFALKEVNLAAYHNAQVQAAAKKGSTIACESDLLKSYSDDECTQEPSGKGKGKEEEPTDWQKFAANNPGKEFTGYDPTGGAHRQVRGPSTIASDRSLEIVTDTPRGRSGYSKGKVCSIHPCVNPGALTMAVLNREGEANSSRLQEAPVRRCARTM